MACTPPILNILLTPATLQRTKQRDGFFPSLFGGEHGTISLHWAICAGICQASVR